MRSWWRRERDLDEEIAGHLRMAAEDHAAGGKSASEAKAAAGCEFGNVSVIKDVTRDMWGWTWLDRAGQDLRYALRLFRRNPSLTISAVLTLAIGIGANTAIFTAARGILLRPLPYDEPDDLVMVWLGRQESRGPARSIATPEIALEWRSRADTFRGMAVLESWRTNLEPQVDVAGDGIVAERLRGSFVSPNFFELLGVRAALGRTFSAAVDDDPLGDAVVLSDALWRRRYGADPAVIGSTAEIVVGRRDRRARTFTIVGVLPSGFQFTYPDETEIWLPRRWAEIERETPRAMMYHVVARLRPEVSFEQAQVNLDAVGPSIVADGLAPAGTAVRLERIHDFAVGQTRSVLLLMTVVAAFLWLVSCVSVANLQLARSAERARELAVRSALGAAPRRIAWQLFVEGLALAGAGGVAGLLTAWLVRPGLVATLPPTYPRVNEIAIDAAALSWAALLASLAAIVAGLAPVWCGTRGNIFGELKRGGLTIVADARTMRWRRMLVGGQVAIVVVLLVGGGLLVRSLWNLQQVNLGFDGRDVLTMELRLLNPKYRDLRALRAFQEDLLQRVRSIPGVSQASMTSSVPFRGVDWMWSLRTSNGAVTANSRDVDPGYFSIMRIGLVEGRLFNNRDTPASSAVAVVSESFAKLAFPGVSAVGQTLHFESSRGRRAIEIVGVVGDVRHERIEALPRAALYVLKAQTPTELICLVIRTALPADGVAAAVRAAVQSLDAYQPVEGITTLDRIVSESVADRRFYVTSTVAFGGIALLLAIVGLYGVVSSGVTQRERELSLRLVLGASRHRVIDLVLRHALSAVGAGLVAGLVAAFWVSRLLQRFLFEVAPGDALTYAAVAGIVIAIALAACLLPAQRALSVNLADAFRAE